MQASHITTNTFLEELVSTGYNHDDLQLLTEQMHRYVIRVFGIPRNLETLLSSISTKYNLHLVCLPSDREHHFFNAYLTGSFNQLQAASNSLSALSPNEAELGMVIVSALRKVSEKPKTFLHLGNNTLFLGKKTIIMGILNVTPDSFSDGGRFNKTDQALEQAYLMAEQGADIIDIGGESTRPGSVQITAEQELKRVMPVIEKIKEDQAFNTPLSIDTYKAAVARQALDAGVEMLNDVWGLKQNPDLGKLAAQYRVPICLMHNRNSTEYRNLLFDIIFELKESIKLAKEAGIADDQIIIDPGIGFGKDLEQNLTVMQHLEDICNIGYPVLLGTSRKSMIGKVLELPVDDRLEGTAATVACGIIAGVEIVRVHDVKQMKRVAKIIDAIFRR